MAAFITGSAGFVGLAVTEALLTRGERVIGFDLCPLSEHAERVFAGLPGRFEQVIGDVCDAEGLKAALRRSDASCVLNLAAVTAGTGREIGDPVGVVRVNIGGAAATIEAAAACGIRRVLHLSSGSVYGASGRDAGLLTEDAPLRPEQLYGITKQASEAVALRLADLHRLDLSIGRLGTCFGRWEYTTGARDTPSAPHQIVQAARSGIPAILPRSHVRDWLYARDAAAAMLELLYARTRRRQVYNLAAGFMWSIADFCARLQQVWSGFEWRFAQQGEAANIDYYAPYDRSPMAIERLRGDTAFLPRYNLAEALADYLQWLGPALDRVPKHGARRHDRP
ncbi:MAG: NAD-dependent epimerase/dehydratase family protein [Bradyrhizobium sp.]